MVARFSNFIKFIMVSTLFACALSARCRASDITDLFAPIKGVDLLFSDSSYDEANLLETCFKVDSSESPFSATFRFTGKDSPPVVEEARLVFSGCGAKNVDIVEIWTTGRLSSYDLNLARREMLAGDEKSIVISIPPTSAEHIEFKFYATGDDGPVALPKIELGGRADIADGAPEINLDNKTDSIVFYNDIPVGRLTSTSSKSKYGYTNKTVKTTKVEYTSADGAATEVINDGYSCEFEFNEDYFIDECRCGMFYPKSTVECETVGRFSAVKTMENGKTITSRSANADRATTIESLLRLMAAGGMAVGSKKLFLMFDPNLFNPINVIAEVSQYIPPRGDEPQSWFVWTHDNEFKSFNTLSMVTDEGEIIRRFDFIGGIEYQALDDADEWELMTLKIDRSAMMKEIIKNHREFIRVPEKTSRADISIRWNGIPPESLHLESERQKLLEVVEVEPGIFEAKLNIMSLYPEGEGFGGSGALSQGELDAYLLPDKVVETGNDNLVKLADKIAGDETDPIATAEKIFNWIVKNMYPNLTNKFKVEKASSILRNLQGDCKQYATMFATLARIRGIPTRFAIGQRYIGGQYGYHVWNQIYADGRWLDVDASSTYFYPGALHIQMTHTSSFNSLSNLGVILGLRPDPKILDYETFEPEYFVFNNGVESSQGDNYYQDSYFKFKLTIPSGFKIDAQDLGFMRKINIVSDSDKKIHLVMFALPSKDEKTSIEAALGSLGDEIAEMMELFGKMKKFANPTAGSASLGGKKGEYFSGSFMDATNGFGKMEITYAQAKNRVFIFFFYGPETSYNKNYDEMKKIKNNLQIFD